MCRLLATFAVFLMCGLCFGQEQVELDEIKKLVSERLGQEDSLSKSLKLRTSSKSLPLWQKPIAEETINLSKAAKSASNSIFLIGDESGTGTGFLISKKNRLVATNAHVVDIAYSNNGKLFAVLNGSNKRLLVEQLWYHPGVRREVAGGSVRSQDPATGEVDGWSPDVAVIQLAEIPEEAEEIPLATTQEIDDLFAMPVGMIGFPAYSTAWPTGDDIVSATYHSGVIARVSNYHLDPNSQKSEMQFVQHTINNFFGFSGSPIFLPSGAVVAINNGGAALNMNGATTSLNFGIRIDALCELLMWHELADAIPAAKRHVTKKRLKVFKRPDKKSNIINESLVFTYRAASQRQLERNKEALSTINKALEIWPQNTTALLYKSRILKQLSQENWTDDIDTAKAYAAESFNTARDLFNQAPSAPSSLINLANTIINSAYIAPFPNGPDKQLQNLGIELLNKVMLEENLTNEQRSQALYLTAWAKEYSKDSLPLLKESIRLFPCDPICHECLLYFYEINYPHKVQEARDKQNLIINSKQAGAASYLKLAKGEVEEAHTLVKKACKSSDKLGVEVIHPDEWQLFSETAWSLKKYKESKEAINAGLLSAETNGLVEEIYLFKRALKQFESNRKSEEE